MPIYGYTSPMEGSSIPSPATPGQRGFAPPFQTGNAAPSRSPGSLHCNCQMGGIFPPLPAPGLEGLTSGMVFFQCRWWEGLAAPPSAPAQLWAGGGGGSTTPPKNASVWIEGAGSEWLHQYRLRNGSGIPT